MCASWGSGTRIDARRAPGKIERVEMSRFENAMKEREASTGGMAARGCSLTPMGLSFMSSKPSKEGMLNTVKKKEDGPGALSDVATTEIMGGLLAMMGVPVWVRTGLETMKIVGETADSLKDGPVAVNIDPSAKVRPAEAFLLKSRKHKSPFEIGPLGAAPAPTSSGDEEKRKKLKRLRIR